MLRFWKTCSTVIVALAAITLAAPVAASVGAAAIVALPAIQISLYGMFTSFIVGWCLKLQTFVPPAPMTQLLVGLAHCRARSVTYLHWIYGIRREKMIGRDEAISWSAASGNKPAPGISN